MSPSSWKFQVPRALQVTAQRRPTLRGPDRPGAQPLGHPAALPSPSETRPAWSSWAPLGLHVAPTAQGLHYSHPRLGQLCRGDPQGPDGQHPQPRGGSVGGSGAQTQGYDGHCVSHTRHHRKGSLPPPNRTAVSE